jgi:hypothetical protein
MIFPSPPGWRLLVGGVMHSDEPDAPLMLFAEKHVIAWRTSDKGPIPVTTDERDLLRPHAIMDPSGMVENKSWGPLLIPRADYEKRVVDSTAEAKIESWRREKAVREARLDELVGSTADRAA